MQNYSPVTPQCYFAIGVTSPQLLFALQRYSFQMCPRSYTSATYWRMKRIQCLLGVNWPCCGIMLLVQGQALNSCEVAKAPPIQLGLKSIQLATFEHSLRSRQIGFKTPWEALVLFLVRFQPVLKSLLQTSPSKPFNTLKNSLPTVQHISAVKLPGLC